MSAPVTGAAAASAPASSRDVEMLIEGLKTLIPKSSQAENTEAIERVLVALLEDGICRLEGSDQEVRPGAVGMQCLIEEYFVDKAAEFKKADLEIHTTMPSTPCCKLPSEAAKEKLLASFSDKERLLTVDGRGKSLDAIARIKNAELHLTFTQEGHSKRTDEQRLAYQGHWKPVVNETVIESVEAIPAEIGGATYRFITKAGTEIYFSIEASQAIKADSKCMVVRLGTLDNRHVEKRVTDVKKGLKELGRVLFES